VCLLIYSALIIRLLSNKRVKLKKKEEYIIDGLREYMDRLLNQIKKQTILIRPGNITDPLPPIQYQWSQQ